ncbi:MAG: S1C family serine protease [Planctomycetota bacterium]
MSYPQVVRVYCTYQDPDQESPWQSLAPRGSTGSGVVIGPGRVLTGAHVVANATFLQVQKQSDPNKVVARIAAISHDSDLALLEIDDPAFTRGIKAAAIGELPRLRDQVAVAGYPVGGDEVSITEGVVSRIEVQRYEHSQRHLLAVTVDAAINDGNSGGPVFHRGKVVGIAFQSLPDAENVGEMVPAPVIKSFLDGTAQQKSPLVPGFGISTQNLENPALRGWLGMKSSDSGVLVTSIQYGTSAWGVLRKGDVLLELDGLKIANNGTVRYRGTFRCQFDVVVGEHFVGDRMRATVLRDGARVKVTMTLQPMAYLVPRYEYDTRPSWFVFGGLVFQRLTAEYLRIWGDNWWEKAPKEFLHFYYQGERTEERQETVVLAHVLADEINVGYEHFQNDSIVEVAGKQPRDLRDFVALVDAQERELVLRTGSGGMLMLDARAARAARDRILAQYRVPADRSRDLQATVGGPPRAKRRARTR